MELNEAIKDPQRPLSISPMEWMMDVEANLAEEEDLTKKVANRIYAKKKDDESQSNKKDLMLGGMETIDMGIDQIVQGIKLIYSGLSDSEKADMNPSMRKVVNGIKDIMDTAITPYTKDLTELSDKFESEDEK